MNIQNIDFLFFLVVLHYHNIRVFTEHSHIFHRILHTLEIVSTDLPIELKQLKGLDFEIMSRFT